MEFFNTYIQPRLINLLLTGFWYYNYALVKLESYTKYFQPYIKNVHTEPKLPSWNCVCTIENGKLLEHYTYGEPLTEWPAGSLYIRKNCEKHRIVHSGSARSGTKGTPNNTRFLNIQYVHPDLKSPLKLTVDLSYIRNGNMILDSIFVKRLLSHQYHSNEYVYDNKYEVHLMDHTINKVVLNNRQSMLFDDLNNKRGYSIVDETSQE
jgi:hypothetical protein